jgi:prepilin-type N-terminal cleavage/methylation domain-containing protein
MHSRPIFSLRPARVKGGFKGCNPRGYTLIEILVALTLTLILMTTVVKVFGNVGTGMRNARRALEQFDRLRTAAQQLNWDLNGITARLDGRAGRPEEALGYLEMIEGSYLFGASGPNGTYYGVDNTGAPDYTVGERGDILLFTTRNATRPFVGRFGYDKNGNPVTMQSDVAEVSWFLRGNRLHRRVLLIVPGVSPTTFTGYTQNPERFYNDYDLSARMTRDASGKTVIAPNSLADLVKRENRYGHDATPGGFPFESRQWLGYGLPTLAECTSKNWMRNWSVGSTPLTLPVKNQSPAGPADMWDTTPNSQFSLTASSGTSLSDQALTNGANDGLRISDDVILTNVIGFDVKVWEPAANGGAGGYIDLGSNPTGAQTPVGPVPLNTFLSRPKGPTYYRFTDGGIQESGLAGSGTTPRIYDSGCFSYANELGGGQATNGMADFNVASPTNGTTSVVDQMSEYVMRSGPLNKRAPGISPYPSPLRGIQITIRCFEPDSRQIREITVEHDFLPK